MTSRRGFLGLIGTVATGAVLDPERLLWVQGAKTISIPKVPEQNTLWTLGPDARLNPLMYAQNGYGNGFSMPAEALNIESIREAMKIMQQVAACQRKREEEFVREIFYGSPWSRRT